MYIHQVSGNESEMEPEEEMAVDFGVSRRHNVIQYRIHRLFYISLFFQFI